MVQGVFVHAADWSDAHTSIGIPRTYFQTQTHLGIKYRNCQANRKKSPGVVGKKAKLRWGSRGGWASERENCVWPLAPSSLPCAGVNNCSGIPATTGAKEVTFALLHFYCALSHSLASSPPPTHPARPPIRPPHLIWRAAKTASMKFSMDAKK